METDLESRIRHLAEEGPLKSVAVAFYDYDSGRSFAMDADRWFHAASTIKAAVLVALFAAVEKGEIKLASPLHVRNRFKSIADGTTFKVLSSRDGDSAVYPRIGRTMKISELAHAMITTSSNLATNLLIDFLGIARVQDFLKRAGIDGIRVLRGVEDEPAFEKGLNNEVTASGLVGLFRLLCEGDLLDATTKQQAVNIFLDQQFNSMIPAGLPSEAKVAHKTGEISTVCHDAGVVYLPDHKPYVVAILTETEPNASGRQKQVAAISQAIYESR